MSNLKICQEKDPIIDFIRTQFDANPIRVPDARITPLSILAGEKGKVRYIGSLKTIFSDSETINIKTTPLVALRGKETSKAKGKLGINLLSGIIKAILGEDPQETQLKFGNLNENNLSVSFSFPDAERDYVDLLQLSKILQQKKPSLSSLELFQRGSENIKFYLVDSVITAKAFGFEFSEQQDKSTEIAATILKDAGVELNNIERKGRKIILKGKKRLAYAFSACGLIIENTIISGIELVDDMVLLGLSDVEQDIDVEYHFFCDNDELLNFEI